MLSRKRNSDVRRILNTIADISPPLCNNRKGSVMFESYVATSVDGPGRAPIFDLKIFCANIHQLCYWPTIHNSISKFCPKFQVISSHFFEVNELLDEHWAKIVQSENISTQIYV